MERNYIDSSMITSMGYDSSLGILEIEFKTNAAVWQYSDVPEYVWYEMQSTESVGKYFHANIRAQYAESRVG